MVNGPDDLPHRLYRLELQGSTLLFLSAANMITNIVTIVIAVLVAWGVTL